MTIIIHVAVSYEKGNSYTCDDVVEISYVTLLGENVTVTGDELLIHHFPVGRTLWLRTPDGISSVSGDGVRAIDVYKE